MNFKLFYLFLYLSFFCLLSFYGNLSLKTVLPTETDELVFYAQENGDDLRRTFKSAIESAKNSILISIYNINDSLIINALNKQAEKQKKITIYYDAKAKGNLPSNFHPKVRLIPFFGKGLMHQKIMIIDDKTIYFGSANLTWSSLSLHGNLVAGLTSEKAAHFLKNCLECQFSSAPFCPTYREESPLNFELWMLPKAKQSVDKVKQLLATAKKTIKVAMYTWTRGDFAESLIQAKNRGVHVEIAVDGNSMGKFSKAMKIIKNETIPLYLYRGPGLLHHKFVWIDETTLIHGSTNWTKAAFNQNYESFMILNQLTSKENLYLKNLWKKIISDCSLVNNPS